MIIDTDKLLRERAALKMLVFLDPERYGYLRQRIAQIKFTINQLYFLMNSRYGK